MKTTIKPLKLKVRVTREDIRVGSAARRSNPFCCPIARAIRRSLRGKGIRPHSAAVSVWIGEVHLWDYEDLKLTKAQERKHALLREAEKPTEVKPFTLDLTFRPKAVSR